MPIISQLNTLMNPVIKYAQLLKRLLHMRFKHHKLLLRHRLNTINLSHLFQNLLLLLHAAFLASEKQVA